MGLISKGDKKAFEYIYRLYSRSLLNYAGEIIKDDFLAEEAIQEVFMKLWQQRESIKIEQSLKSYLFRSTFHYCINVINHRKVEDKYKAFFLHHIPMGDANEALSDDFPLAGLLGSELESIVTKAIDKLPDQCRKVFMMSRYENLKHEIIAQKLNVSVNTVHTQIIRALTKLRAELKNYLSLLF
jgi:RNA polymerase sigma-70 factor (ECF subfamily)